MKRDYIPIDKPKRPRRRTYADNQQLAQPKPGVRVRDEAPLKWARSLGVCEWCGARGPTHASHAKSQGSGGHDSYDNIVACCTSCEFDNHHRGREPTTQQLLETARRREQFGRANAADLASRHPAMYCFSSAHPYDLPARTSASD